MTSDRRKYPHDLGRPARALLQDEFSEAELDRDNSRLVGKERAAIATLRVGAIERRRELARRSAMKAGDDGGWRDGDTVSGVPNWVELGPRAVPNGQTYSASRVIVSGRIAGIAVHPTTPATIYVAGARGGIWKTIDGGATWSAKSDNEISLAMGAIALAPSAPDTIYAGTGEGHIYYLTAFNPLNALNESYQGSGILKSTDGGATWTRQAAAELTGAACYRIVVHPTNPLIAFAATSRGLYRTIDGGTTWSQVAGLPAIGGSVIACTDVAIDPTNGDRVWTAFWGSGIYETSNATTAGGPAWALVTGNPSSPGRIALAVSPSSPATVYALEATAGGSYKGLYQTTGGVGGTWAPITYSGTTPNVSTSRCCMGVDVTTPDVVYLCGVSLHKVVRNAATNTWAATDIGLNIHPDNRTFAAHPTDPLSFYAGTDGGIYATSDGGNTWSDSINKRLNLMQFEFIDQHPAYDAIVFGGTQDNGTDQFRTSEVFYHAADGDGGAVAVDQTDPRNVLIEHYSVSPERSNTAGKFGTFSGIGGGIAGASLFYPLFDLDRTNQQNIAFGTDRLNLDAAQGTGGWPTQIALPGIAGLVSAVAYVNSTLVYAATSSGEVYRAVFAAGSWTAVALHAAPLPGGWIWDIAVSPTDPSQLTIGFGGFGISHVWRGVVSAAGTSATWTDISGAAPQALPDAPVNSLALDPLHPGTIYAGTDIGVFATTNDGSAWISFREGLPNTAIYDLKLHSAARLLRAATHGRGIWERDIDAATSPDAVICLRDNVMHTGRGIAPSGVSSALEDTLQHVALGDPVYWWQCADAKVDALAGSPPTYQFPVPGVDFVTYEAQLSHRDPQRGRVNNLYITVHNRGISAGTVTVKLLFADATMSLPDLPADFWSAFPGDPAPGSAWTPIGAAQTLTVEPGLPTIFYWPWTTPAAAAQHSCLLIVTDAPEDPIPGANKVFNIGALVTGERHVGLKNLHVIDPAADGPGDVLLLPFTLNAKGGDTVRIVRSRLPGWKMGLVVPSAVKLESVSEPLLARKPSGRITRALADHFEATARRAPASIQHVGFARAAAVFRLPRAIATPAFIALERGARKTGGTITLIQERDGRVLGGNTFVVPSHESAKAGERRTG